MTIPGYRWIIDVTLTRLEPPPLMSFSIEVFAWNMHDGTHGTFSSNVRPEVGGTGTAIRWRWTEAVRVVPPTKDEKIQSVELWPQWAETLSVSPYRVRYPVPLSVGSIAFDIREGRGGVIITRPYIRKGTGCLDRPNMTYPDDFPALAGMRNQMPVGSLTHGHVVVAHIFESGYTARMFAETILKYIPS